MKFQPSVIPAENYYLQKWIIKFKVTVKGHVLQSMPDVESILTNLIEFS